MGVLRGVLRGSVESDLGLLWPTRGSRTRKIKALAYSTVSGWWTIHRFEIKVSYLNPLVLPITWNKSAQKTVVYYFIQYVIYISNVLDWTKPEMVLRLTLGSWVWLSSGSASHVLANLLFMDRFFPRSGVITARWHGKEIYNSDPH